ncbi:MAG: aminoacyl-tRNA hydrolase, partial [Patescibacteria group bacterium]
ERDLIIRKIQYMRIIIGLGKPGAQYRSTRHNVGWAVLDALAGKQKWQTDAKAKAQYCELSDDILLIKPQTFMNASGQTAAYLHKKLPRLPLTDWLIVHDDKDINFGKIKLTAGARSAGHNGVQSIIESLGTQDIPRLRIGVNNAAVLSRLPTDKFVLAKFTPAERQQLPGIIQEAVQKISHN